MVDTEKCVTLTEEQLNSFGKAAGREGAKEVLLELGIDVNAPLDMQADFRTLRNIRRLIEKGSLTAFLTLLMLIVGGIASLVWDAFRR